MPVNDTKPDFVTVFVAFEDYNEGEFAGIADALNDAGYRMVIVSTQTGTVHGMSGAGCENSGQQVTIDGNVVTGSGPAAAQEFGLAVVSVLDTL